MYVQAPAWAFMQCSTIYTKRNPSTKTNAANNHPRDSCSINNLVADDGFVLGDGDAPESKLVPVVAEGKEDDEDDVPDANTGAV